MKRLFALLAVIAAAIAAVVIVGSGTPAGAGTTNLGTLTPAPEPSNIGTAVTVTPESPCPQASTDVLVTYSLANGTQVDSATIAVDSNGDWTDTVTMDAAGDYFVNAACNHPTGVGANAAHRSAAGLFIVDGFYEEAEFHVNGLVAANPKPSNPGQNVAFTPTFTDPAVGSRCPGGEVSITITDPDNVALVTDAQPTVLPDGSWTLNQILTKVGTYTVTGTCNRVLANPTAGHLAPAQLVQTNDFTYSGSAQVAAQATTTTTAPPEEAAAEAVEAAPTFTG
jgi:hypothetical protein